MSLFEKYLFILLVVGFYTLLERKLLSFLQLRKGPNKVSVLGLLQPIADAIKLFLKEKLFSKNTNILGFFLIPVSGLILIFLLWGTLILPESSYFLKFTILLIICISSLRVFPIFASRWSSNSKYARLGGMRAIAQIISYEVVIILVLILFFFCYTSIESNKIFLRLPSLSLLRVRLIMAFVWLLLVIAETNRAPFDFAEGESEIVSGFNIEYGRFEFALLFISEYRTILFFSVFSTLVLFNPGGRILIITALSVFIAILIIFFRGRYPRIRYDQLMSLSWKRLINISLIGVSLLLVSF